MPHTRKIDDDELLDLYQQGIPQKDIATHFNVSPVAVCKRLQRLLPQPEGLIDQIQRKHDLTEKETRFCLEKAKGRTNTQAALASYEVGSIQSAKAIGSGLMGKPEIQQTIEELLNTHGLTKSYRVGKLRRHVDNRDPHVSLKALDMTFKIDRTYTESPQVTVNYNELVIEQENIADEIKYLQAKRQELLQEVSGESDD